MGMTKTANKDTSFKSSEHNSYHEQTGYGTTRVFGTNSNSLINIFVTKLTFKTGTLDIVISLLLYY